VFTTKLNCALGKIIMHHAIRAYMCPLTLQNSHSQKLWPDWIYCSF